MVKHPQRSHTVLSDREVKRIRELHEKGETVRAIAEKYGVSHSQIGRIVLYKSRRDV